MKLFNGLALSCLCYCFRRRFGLNRVQLKVLVKLRLELQNFLGKSLMFVRTETQQELLVMLQITMKSLRYVLFNPEKPQA